MATRNPRRRTQRPAAQQRGRGFMLLVGFAGLGVAGLLAYVGFNAPNSIPGRGYYHLTAQLNQADNLTGHYQIRIAGRLVGQVLNPRVENGKAVVDLQMEKDVGPLLSDTRIRVRPRSPIGVRFVQLEPGTRGTPLKDGAVLPASQASSSLPLDEVLSTFDPKTRARTQELLAGLGGGFAGRGDDVNATLASAPDFLRLTDQVTTTINRRAGAPQSLVNGTQAAAAAADPVRDTIATGFAPEARASKAFADSRAEIGRLLQVAPGTLRGTRDGLAASTPLLNETSGFAKAARPLLQAAPASLRQTSALMREARPATRRLSDTLHLAQRAVNPTLALLKITDPVLPNANTALTKPLPIFDDLAPRQCDVIQMVRNWESMLAWGQDGGNYLRFDAIVNAESLSGAATPGPFIRGTPYPAPCVKTKEGPR